MSQLLDTLKMTAGEALNLMMQEVLDENSYMPVLAQNRHEFLTQFVSHLSQNFDQLQAGQPAVDAVAEFQSFSTVDEEESKSMAACDGMVAAARNRHQQYLISFNERLTSFLNGTTVDESTNPLDPQQLFACFTKVMRNFGIANPAENVSSLIIFRSFNDIVLHNIDRVLEEADAILKKKGSLPEMDSGGAKVEIPSGRLATRTEAEDTDISTFGNIQESTPESSKKQPKLFSVMQNLLHREISQTNDQAQNLAPHELLNILTEIQKPLTRKNDKQTEVPTQLAELEKINISASLDEFLKQQGESLRGIDQQSSDVINLVSLLYDVIWQDDSLPVPIKDLIGRTQIAIIKVALSDTTFFDQEDHPGRLLLNEIASAGIGWMESLNVDQDPLYRKIADVVHTIQSYHESKIEAADRSSVMRYYDYLLFFEDLLREFRQFRTEELARQELQLRDSEERQERLSDVRKLVTAKIAERIKDRPLPPLVSKILKRYFHKFMVMVATKEGQGSNAWKHCINTIDVLLWSIESRKATDRDRFDAVNPRLLNNLRRAFAITQLEAELIDSLIDDLEKIQDAPGQALEPADDSEDQELITDDEKEPVVARTETALAADDPVFQEVDALAVGIWVEFSGVEENQAVRCKLASRVEAIDKYIFINRQGVKVVEKSRDGLARELKDRTVKIVTEGQLFSRALESVIGDLRVSHREQQTGSAYQPDAEPKES